MNWFKSVNSLKYVYIYILRIGDILVSNRKKSCRTSRHFYFLPLVCLESMIHM